jgi:protease I
MTSSATIDEVAADDYDGVLIPSGAKSPLILSGDERVKKFVQAMAGSEKLVASIWRGALVLAQAGIVPGRHVTGFTGDSELSEPQARELAVEPLVRRCGGIWDDREAVVDRNFISSRHPRDIKSFTDAICEYLWGGAKQSPFNDRIAE